MVKQVKKIHYNFRCLSCSHEWKHHKGECNKCPNCGKGNIKITGFGGSIGPIDEDMAYA
jgi:Zn finger protein HypA/HybF involved in hydrogenase expression